MRALLAVLLCSTLAHAQGGWLESFGRGRLVRELEDPDPAVRERAARGIGREGSAHAVAPLVARLPVETDVHVREAIADALGEIGDRGGVPVLVRILQRAGDPARVAAARALGRIGDPDAVEALADATGDRLAGVEALAALARIGDRSIPTALALLRDPARATLGVRILGVVGDPRALPALLGALEHERGDVRAEAARALGALEDPRAVAALRKAEREADPRVRDAAGAAIARLLPEPPPADERTIASLVSAAPHGAGALRSLALRLHPRPGLGFTPEAPATAVGVVRRLLASRDDATAARAAFAAGAIGLGESAATLHRILRTAKRSVGLRRAAALALGRLGQVGALRKAADHEREPAVRAAVARALGETHANEAIPALLRMLRRADDASPGAATSLAALGAGPAAPLLREALRAPDAPLRAAAAAGLARMGDPRSRMRLRLLAEEDGVAIVRRAAALEDGPVPRGESILRWRSGGSPGARVVVETPEGRVYVEWTDEDAEVVLFDVALGVGRIETALGQSIAVATD